MNIVSIFKKLGGLVKRAFAAAASGGLTDAIIGQAGPLVLEAEGKFTDKAARREWVVGMLVAMGIPESIARVAVELALQLVKRHTAAQKPHD